jgi:hypothetical protein
LEEELETTLNFLRKTTTFIAKLVPQVIVILDSKEKVKVGPQLVVEEQLQSIFVLKPMEEEKLQLVVYEQPQPIPTLRPMEEKKLQQLVSSGEVFFQELFEERPISSIIPQRLKSRTRTMMKQKGKTLVKKQVEKPIKKKPVSKAKESQKMLQWMMMDSNKLKWAKQADLQSVFNLQWTTPRKDLLRNFLQTWEATNDGRILPSSRMATLKEPISLTSQECQVAQQQ